jgi:excisionase family DNA binding protein
MEVIRLEKYFTVLEAAKYLNTSDRFVRRIIAERRIAFHRVGRHVRISLLDLDEFLKAGRVEPMTAAEVWRGRRRAG